jgi:thiol:disulfide interchange protein DsbG
MQLTIKIIITMAILLSMPVIAQAADYPKVIQRIEKQGAKVEKKFPAASGMTGWVLSQAGQYSVVFTGQENGGGRAF